MHRSILATLTGLGMAVAATVGMTTTPAGAATVTATAHTKANASAKGSPVSEGGAPGRSANAHGVYLALGDSLAAGYQPDKGDDKTGGYVGKVFADYRTKHNGGRLINLACSGETTVSLIGGGKCGYGADGNQLGAALHAIKQAKGKVSLITLDIGANDVQTCVSRVGVIDYTCLGAGLDAVAKNLPTIVGKLRTAAGPKTQIVLLNYYNPFLAVWLLGNTTVAQASVGLQQTLDASIAAAAKKGSASVADVAAAFKSDDWTPVAFPSVGTAPTNVAMVCTYTWMCTKSDIHANDLGYALMASTITPQVR